MNRMWKPAESWLWGAALAAILWPGALSAEGKDLSQAGGMTMETEAGDNQKPVPSIEIKLLETGVVMEVSGDVDEEVIDAMSTMITSEAAFRSEQHPNKWLNCGGWSRKWVNAGDDYYFFFYPGRAGTHEIRFHSSGAYLWAGHLSSYWRNLADGVTSWQYFATDTVERLPDQHERDLYSGTEDVEYQFKYSASRGAYLFWNLCKD